MNIATLQRRFSRLALVLALTIVSCQKRPPPTLADTFADMRLATVKARLNSGADPNEQDSQGRSMLHAAVFYGKLDIVRYLLEHKATLDIRTPTGITPLAVAVWRDDIKIAEFLIRQGADVNVRSSRDGRSILDVSKSDAMTKLLLAHGAKHGSELQ
jgi:ankyrin repeat protein